MQWDKHCYLIDVCNCIRDPWMMQQRIWVLLRYYSFKMVLWGNTMSWKPPGCDTYSVSVNYRQSIMYATDGRIHSRREKIQNKTCTGTINVMKCIIKYIGRSRKMAQLCMVFLKKFSITLWIFKDSELENFMSQVSMLWNRINNKALCIAYLGSDQINKCMASILLELWLP